MLLGFRQEQVGELRLASGGREVRFARGRPKREVLMTALTTARLVLREFEEADTEAVHAYASDPETTQYMSWGPNTLDDTRAFVEHCCATAAAVPRVDYEWAVTVPSGVLVGGCGIGVRGGPARQGYLGYILHRDHWGQGYATEAAAAMVAFGFEQLGLHRIWSDCVAQNRASAHVMEKCGLRREGCLRHYSIRAGSWRDHLVYSALEGEYRTLKGNADRA
jgi:ribosomal-protein-alanine N-acetyltransferase